MKKCVIKDCDGERRARGLCPNCYWCAAKMVREGKMTWEKLVAKKAALPLHQRKFTKQLKVPPIERRKRTKSK